MSGVIGIKKLVEIRWKLRRQGKRVVFTNGVFDILHVGHLSLLERAKSFGDILIVGVNSDDSVNRLKGKKRPLIPYRDRARLLAALKPVDFVVRFSEDTPLNVIKKIKPDVLVKGADYRVSEIVGAPEVKSWGGVVRRVRILSGRSSSGIIKKL